MKVLIMKFLFFLLLYTICSAQSTDTSWVKESVKYVDPFIGTGGEKVITHAANIYPGAVMPFGMMSFGPECSVSDKLAEQRCYKMMKENGGESQFHRE